MEESAAMNNIANHLHHHTDFILEGSQNNPNIALEEILKKTVS
jgi:hypothetical protein